MTNRNEVYKCEKCGNLIGIIIGAGGGLVCCGENMVPLKGNTTDAAQEKHIPVITKRAVRLLQLSARYPTLWKNNITSR